MALFDQMKQQGIRRVFRRAIQQLISRLADRIEHRRDRLVEVAIPYPLGFQMAFFH